VSIVKVGLNLLSQKKITPANAGVKSWDGVDSKSFLRANHCNRMTPRMLLPANVICQKANANFRSEIRHPTPMVLTID
jgi:hypothetical protein